MHERQALLISENEDSNKHFEHRPLCAAQAGGMIPPDMFGRNRQSANEIILFGTIEIFPAMSGALSGQNIGKASQEEDEQRRKLADVRAYIQTHYAEKLTLKKVAAFAGMMPAELSRIFRGREGLSLFDYIENTRLERAAALLRGTNRTISAIAGSVGFSGISHFHLRFREAYGMTPGHYRRKCLREAKPSEVQ